MKRIAPLLVVLLACAPSQQNAGGYGIEAISGGLAVEVVAARFGALDDETLLYGKDQVLGNTEGDAQEFVVTLVVGNNSDIRADNHTVAIAAFDAGGQFVGLGLFDADQELLAKSKLEKTLVGTFSLRANPKRFFVFVRGMTLTNQTKRSANLTEVAAQMAKRLGRPVDAGKL